MTTLDDVLDLLAAPFAPEDVEWFPKEKTTVNGRVMMVPVLKADAIRKRFSAVLPTVGGSWREDSYENDLGCHCAIRIEFPPNGYDRYSWDREPDGALRKVAASFRVGQDILLYQGEYAPQWRDA